MEKIMELGESISLTDSQMKIWVGQSLSPNYPLYNMVLTFEIQGAIDINRFQLAFQKLVDQNDVLRLIIEEEELPVQRFYSTYKSPLEFIDFSSSSNPLETYLQWVEQHKSRIFHSGDILYHTALIKIKEDLFVWYFNQHHVITDGWSLNYLYDEMVRLYESNNSKVEAKLDIQKFENFARNQISNNLPNKNIFWESKNANKYSNPTLYGVKSKNANSKSSRFNIKLGERLTKELKELALNPNFRSWNIETTISQLFLTALAGLIYKIGDLDEFTIGTPFHNRINKTQKETAGLFMGLLPIGISVNSEDSLIDIFNKLKEETFLATKNALESAPSIEVLKSFNVVLNYIPNGLTNFGSIPMKCEWLLSGDVDPNHHLRLQIQDFNQEENYNLQFDFNHQVFESSQYSIISNHFLKMIDALLSNCNQTLANIDLITEEEQNKISEWNSTEKEMSHVQFVLSKFEEQAQLIPEKVALFFKNESITYKELDAKSNQHARFLIEEGVKPGDIVAISVDRSLEMMFGMYGILKAGAAYLPIDPYTPINRLKLILKDSKPSAFLVNHINFEGQDEIEMNAFNLKEIQAKIQEYSINKPSVEIDSESLAYVIYTSGSTGTPKGVKCHHKGICNRLNWVQDLIPLNEKDRMLQKTPITFDVSLTELFWPLGAGASLAIEEPDGHKNNDQLVESIRKFKVTTIHFVPSMLGTFIEHSEVTACKSLKHLICSGEALSASLVNKSHEVLLSTIYNLYGPTEASVDVSYYTCTRDNKRDVIPIGYAVSNTQLHVLDKTLKQVPIGCLGELYISGDQVALGYLNREELSQERFIQNIYSNGKLDKMYKTGDLVRYRLDGALEYQGRLDEQVKLKGFRIELGEIEANLMNHPLVNQAIVSMETKENGFQFLVAYYTGKKIEESEFKSHLSKSLPEYMLPSFFKHLEKFELTSSGKLDRKKLPTENDFNALILKTEYLAPRNDIEELIVGIWEEVLKIDPIGMNDDFIQIGGDSLAALVITSRVKKTIELDVRLDLIFRFPTVAEYANNIEKTILELLAQE